MQSAKIAAKQVSGNECRAAQQADTLGKIGVHVVNTINLQLFAAIKLAVTEVWQL